MARFKTQIMNDYFAKVEKQIIDDLSKKGNEFINNAEWFRTINPEIRRDFF